MKKVILSFVLLSSSVFALEVPLEQHDQSKLAWLVSKLPLTVRARAIQEKEGMLHVHSVVPKTEGAPFKMECQSSYQGRNEFPSSSSCRLFVDENHQSIEHGYDEYRLKLAAGSLTSAFFENISYGVPEKDFRSRGRFEGTTFEGEKRSIFHYLIRCLPESCDFRFASRVPSPVNE